VISGPHGSIQVLIWNHTFSSHKVVPSLLLIRREGFEDGDNLNERRWVHL